VDGKVVRKFWLAFNFCRKKQSPIQSGRVSKQLLNKTNTTPQQRLHVLCSRVNPAADYLKYFLFEKDLT